MNRLAAITAIALMSAVAAFSQRAAGNRPTLPRTADGKPNLQGIWQASSTAAADLQDHAASYNMLAGKSVVSGGEIPYQPWAAAKKAENFKNRQMADPVNQCFIPGVPRVMYMEFPFQIFQTPREIAIAFEWSLDYRLIHADGSPHPADLDFWMGDSRGHWEGDTLVVDTTNLNGKTWLNEVGEIVSYAQHVVERFTPVDADTVNYEATVSDPVVYTRPWTIAFPIKRNKFELFEAACHEEDRDLPRLKALKDAAAAKK